MPGQRPEHHQGGRQARIDAPRPDRHGGQPVAETRQALHEAGHHRAGHYHDMQCIHDTPVAPCST
ncbi:Uncharacterised protein [Bordetella pertussis]|nr:Uncharacterised protein [Bordetella pertussis]